MISWSAPAYLWLLLLPLPVAALCLRARRKRRRELAELTGAELPELAGAEGAKLPGAEGAELAGTEGAAAGRLGSGRLWDGLGRLLQCTAWLLLVISLAGPRWGAVAEERQSQGAEILIALDCSRSMLTDDLGPSRLAATKEAIAALVSELHGDRIGLIAFAGSAFPVCPLTSDYGAFAAALAEIGTDSIPLGGTSLAAPLVEANRSFACSKGGGRALILVSDGEAHDAGYAAAALALKERGVAVYTVAAGTLQGGLIPLGQGEFVKDRGGAVVKSRLRREPLQEIAAAAGGRQLDLSGGREVLAELYRKELVLLERRSFRGSATRFGERFQIPLALALALLGIEPLLGGRRQR